MYRLENTAESRDVVIILFSGWIVQRLLEGLVFHSKKNIFNLRNL